MCRLLFLFALSLVSCTSRQGYRQAPSATVEKLEHNISLAHVEIDDQGELISFDQLQRTTKALRKASKTPRLVVVFIHGWNYNSSSSRITGGGNLRNFRKKLSEVAGAQKKLGNGSLKPFGIFISWRGRSASPFPVGIDYFHRHSAARRVGGVAGAEVLHEIAATARSANPKNRIVMIGHSLGGAMLESALSEAMAAQIASAHGAGRTLKRQDFPADLAITVNAAESALYARQLINTFKNRGIRKRSPLIVSLSGEKDFPNSLIFPAGNIVGRWLPPFNFFNTSVSGTYRKDPATDSQRGTQAAAHRTTVGNFLPLHSHALASRSLGQKKLPLKEIIHRNKSPRNGTNFTIRGSKERFTFKPREERYNDTPYWIMEVPDKIIEGHNGIWSDNFVGMITGLLAMVEE